MIETAIVVLVGLFAISVVLPADRSHDYRGGCNNPNCMMTKECGGFDDE